MTPATRLALWRWGLVAAWCATVLTLSSDAFGGDETGRWLHAVLVRVWPDASPETIRLLHRTVRKLAHVVEYAILAVLLARAFAAGDPRRARAAVLAIALAAGFAVGDEARQSLTRSRVPSHHDVALDTSGALAGAMLWRRRAPRDA